ncbi:polysaccharide deacetylase family protein [Streptomyces sp. HPF1205]|uniref:polysaccharide deacetylase family protein n=1 Tax=Streptomyces sp. HPF1205 TaxID=2873262 RepID=UPI001CEC0859|nr:polysaccharide deacetylase family protein [Streptomyces sp. HPF1205]
MTRPAAAGRAAAAVTAAVLAGHVVPAATWLPRLRRVCFPSLAGIGRPDHVALTFDDGPDPRSTAAFLDVLDALDTKATFFVLGESLARARHLGREIAARGHELAVHGWTHEPRLLPAPVAEAAAIARTAAAVENLAGAPPLWYRPPFGVLTGDRLLAARAAGLRPVLWSAWGRDWTAAATPASVLAATRADLRGGGTVLLHDSDSRSAPGCWRATLAALPALVAGCRSAGLAVGPLREHGIGR